MKCVHGDHDPPMASVPTRQPFMVSDSYSRFYHYYSVGSCESTSEIWDSKWAREIQWLT